MTKPLPRTGFNSSRLIRLLADIVADSAAVSNTSIAERLGQWLGFSDAIALSAALNAGVPAADEGAAAALPQDAALRGVRTECARVQAALVDAIVAEAAPGPGRARIKLPSRTAAAGDFTPYRRYYAAHQREMECALAPLRARVRAVLRHASPLLARLAALDAVLEKALGGRERDLLAAVPQLLERRFVQLVRGDVGAGNCSDGAAIFCRDLQAVLLAELELRLQPLLGLLDAATDQGPDAAVGVSGGIVIS